MKKSVINLTQSSVKRRKNPVSATASPRERDNENSYIFAAKAAVVLLRQIVYS